MLPINLLLVFPLRCLGAVATKMPSPWKRRSRADTPDHAPTVTMTTPPAMYDNQTFEMEQVEISSTNSPPPPKPQRSFRDKRREEQETTTYLEGCDYKQEEEREKVEVAGGSLEERNNGSVVEEEERGEGGGSHTETDDEESSEEGEMENGESREEITKEKEVEEEGEQQNKNKDGEWSRGGEEVVEKGSDEDREEEEGKRKEEDGETGSDKQEDPEPATSPPRPSRRSRVIRLYQYDDDGQRYCHLPDPTPNEPGPAPRLKQRSLSLTRLSAIMTAASAGPLDTEETGREERTHFHMEIWRTVEGGKSQEFKKGQSTWQKLWNKFLLYKSVSSKKQKLYKSEAACHTFISFLLLWKHLQTRHKMGKNYYQENINSTALLSVLFFLFVFLF